MITAEALRLGLNLVISKPVSEEVGPAALQFLYVATYLSTGVMVGSAVAFHRSEFCRSAVARWIWIVPLLSDNFRDSSSHVLQNHGAALVQFNVTNRLLTSFGYAAGVWLQAKRLR